MQEHPNTTNFNTKCTIRCDYKHTLFDCHTDILMNIDLIIFSSKIVETLKFPVFP
jgi:hypothetical protein